MPWFVGIAEIGLDAVLVEFVVVEELGAIVLSDGSFSVVGLCALDRGFEPCGELLGDGFGVFAAELGEQGVARFSFAGDEDGGP